MIASNHPNKTLVKISNQSELIWLIKFPIYKFIKIKKQLNHSMFAKFLKPVIQFTKEVFLKR